MLLYNFEFHSDIDLIYDFALKKNPLSAVAATFIFKMVGKYLKFFWESKAKTLKNNNFLSVFSHDIIVHIPLLSS